ncbi:MAG TPA: hypothetical protein VFT43_12315, partial [Candidatus Polarisedimenticolia bacterium]|nr:hypothetical protein [Candidatus Polarisedimenticolia bacterium]
LRGVAAVTAILLLAAGAAFSRSGDAPGVPESPSPSSKKGAPSGGPAVSTLGAPAPVPPSALRFAPRARRLTTYTNVVRLEITTRDVTFEAPPAYQQSFAFWSGRMKGETKIELFEFQTLTQERAGEGTVPFKRTLPRFQVELQKQGGPPQEPYGTLQSDVTSLAWEGTLDAFGNVKEIHRVAGKENPEFADLGLEQIESVFPRAGEPKEIPVGAGFTESGRFPLPTPLHIKGLEKVGMVMTREYRLRDVKGEVATFDVTVSYANDPATPVTAPGTTCVIAGGGKGELVFETRRGVFLSSRLPTTMTIDIKAPLRPLPDKPETATPGAATTHMTIDLLLSAEQTAKRVWGEEED